MKVHRATIVPLFSVYDGNTSLLHIYLPPPIADLTDADEASVARRINEALEILVRPNPEQYYVGAETPQNPQAQRF